MTEPTKSDYWRMKKEDLLAACAERDVPVDPDNLDRKTVIPMLIEADAKAGNLGEAVELDEKPKPVREYVDIIFNNQEGQPKYVFLGLNGRSLYLPREVVCRIPAEFMSVVKDAVSYKSVMTTTSDGKIKWQSIRVPQLSYQVIDKGTL